MVKVLFFEVDSVFGGIESFLLNMLRNINLHDSDIQFDFVTSAEKPAALEAFQDAGVNILNVGEKKNLIQYYRNIDDLFKTGQYSIVHIQKNSLSNAIPLLIARKHNVPYILHAQNSAPSSSNYIVKSMHYVNRMIFAHKAKLRLACGETAAKWMFKSINGVKIIKNGINPAEFTRDNEIRRMIRSKYDAESDLVICNVGRFTDQKNHRLIIQIFYEINKINKKTKLFLVGDGANFDEIKKVTKELKLENYVTFFGSLERSEESKVLIGSDVFLMPSLYEGVSIASIEAQMAGLQLFMSDTVDKDTNITGNVKFLSLNQEPKEWARIILDCVPKNKTPYNSYELVQNIRAAGYDMKHTTDMLIKMYKSNALSR